MLFTALSHIAIGQTTDFSWNTGGNTCLPIDVQFTQTSSGTPKGYLWDFGNGTKSNSPTPLVTFSTPGTYTVRLITVYQNNTAQRTRTITIHNSISANFISDRSQMCTPGIVNFTATSSGANLDHYTWNFGDDSPEINSSTNTIAHTYTGYGEFTVSLTALSTAGCSVTSSRTIKVIRPQLSGNISTALLGCIPMTTNFSASVNLLPGNNVTGYIWDFGDGSNLANTTNTAISHTYNQVGSFSPSVTVTTTDGCSSTYHFDSLAFGRPPVNNVAYPLDTVYCGSETPQFVSSTPTANRYDWDFGGGGIQSVTDTFVEHRYSNLGYKNITVTPVYNGCPGTPTSFRINIIGVIARFKYANTCDDKKTFVFNNTSQGNISTIHWSLGNQAYSANMNSVVHTYPPSGVFAVKLLITDNITGCVDSFKTRIYTANPVLKNNDVSICINTDTRFSVLNNYTNPALTYLWNVMGDQIGPGVEVAPVVHADSLGHFNNSVILDNGPQYCPDTIHLDHLINVRGPKLDFTIPPSICLDVPLSVVNLSHPFEPADTINQWYWNFGRPEANATGFQPAPYTYPVARIYPYRVKLTAIDITGCQDSLIQPIMVRPMPFMWIIPKEVDMCQGQNTTFIGYTSDPILWSPVIPNFCTTCDTTTVAPVQTTRLYATATNSFNCSSTDSAMVRIVNPFVAVPLTPTTSICRGESVQLDVNPKNKKIVWSPVEGLSGINIHNPVATPNQSTTYVATMADSSGCFSSTTSIKITVKSKPEVDAGPDKVLPYNTTFRLDPTYSSNVSSWLWTPGDSLSCNNCPTPITTALRTKTYTVTAVSDSGCVSRDNITVFVECKNANLLLPNAFTPNNDNVNDVYHPLARGIKSINRFAVFNREGQLLYELRDFVPGKMGDTRGWNGKYKGQDQPAAAYVYLIEAVCDIGQTIFSKGSFILIR